LRSRRIRPPAPAAAEHLEKWARRLDVTRIEHVQLERLAQKTHWERHPARCHSVASAIYRRLPDDARLWLRRGTFIAPDRMAIGRALDVRRPGQGP
jgi:hypothetical protein